MIKNKFKAKKQFNKKSSAFLITGLIMVLFTALVAASANALIDTTRPAILSVSPANNERNDPRNEQIVVAFSEEMNPSTINANTFLVTQRTTPDSGVYRAKAISGVVSYNSYSGVHVATFTSNELFSPNQQYGNVFTVEITDGAKDLAGNSISQNYMWSFTTGSDPFNTGATTSQLNQGGVPISGAVTVPIPTQQPVVVAAPATAPVAAESTFPWAWVLGGLLLFLVIALIYMLTNRSADEEVIQDVRSNPFGDVHPVMDIEGIGPEYKERLDAMGIKNTEQLWKADAAEVSRETDAPVSTVKSWQHMAELASVNDIGPQYAELLERSGVHSIGQLRSYEPNKLLKLVRKKQDSLKINIQGNFPGHDMVEHWIDEARGHKFSGFGGRTV